MRATSRLRRPLLALGALAVVVIAASGMAIVLGGGVPGGGGGSTPTPVASLAVVSPSASAAEQTFTPGPPTPAGASAPPAQSHAPTSGPGIRATRIEIARLGIDLPIVEGDGIDAPIGKAAHFPGTAWPDGGTNIYIYAHARTGMFLDLWRAAVGDRVDLTLVDGSKRSYIVDQVLPRVPANAVRYLQPTPTEQLTLQTSTGPDSGYPRFVVIAHPAP